MGEKTIAEEALKKITAQYEEQTGKRVPNRYKNDVEWITSHLSEAAETEAPPVEEEKPAEEKPKEKKKDSPPPTTKTKHVSGTVLKKSIVYKNNKYEEGEACPDGLDMNSLAERGVI